MDYVTFLAALSLVTLTAGLAFGIRGYLVARRAKRRGEHSAFHWREEQAEGDRQPAAERQRHSD